MQDASTKLWSRQGIIKAVRPSGRSYIVDSDDRLYKRNIKWLRPMPVESVTVVTDDVQGADTGGESAVGVDDTAGESAAGGDDGAGCGTRRSPSRAARSRAPAAPARRARRSCLAGTTEKRCYLGGEELPRKSVTWARPLYTTVTLQSYHEQRGGHELHDAAHL